MIPGSYFRVPGANSVCEVMFVRLLLRSWQEFCVGSGFVLGGGKSEEDDRDCYGPFYSSILPIIFIKRCYCGPLTPKH